MVAIADVVDAPRVNAWPRAALKKFGRIDYLINNAALRAEKANRAHELRGLAPRSSASRSTARSIA
jgi:NAD(P)-dependent dehydrogenase (short-subunit alcohol dehydrogenase family)